MTTRLNVATFLSLGKSAKGNLGLVWPVVWIFIHSWTIGNMNTSETARVYFLFPNPPAANPRSANIPHKDGSDIDNHPVDSIIGGGFGSPPLNMKKQLNFHESRQGETRGAGPVTSEQEARGDSGNQSIDSIQGGPAAARRGTSRSRSRRGRRWKHAKPACRCIPGIGRVGLRFAGRSLSFWILWIGSCPHRLSCRTVPGLSLIGCSHS
ncbi:hypothetical protein An08g07160 [Aspergillus niger]|uniref:Uncharacterized protein n=2 Tax=Aspergillus niger TaxID=5061 RepID=A2QRT5_ASPNC|nr:hypothetical protein An08g07160 [Aspergillus niger]CAK39963.1 hypothetical protein An08g07160 [Aspergillus niger]